MHRRAHVVSLLGLAVVALAVFGALASAVVRDSPLVDLDRRVAEWVAAEMPDWAEWLARPFTWLGGWVGLTIVAVVLVVALLLAGRVWDAVWVALAVTATQVLTAMTKGGYDRPRPDVGSAIELPTSASFPSGHASGAIVMAGVVAALAWRRWSLHHAVVLAVAAFVTFAVGASRVVLGVHYVTDVVAGFAFGAAGLALLLVVRLLAGQRGTST